MVELGMVTPHNIKIEPTKNKGFIVRVGCATLVYEKKEKMMADLQDYLDHPEAHEEAYNAILCNDVPQAAEPCQAECPPQGQQDR